MRQNQESVPTSLEGKFLPTLSVILYPEGMVFTIWPLDIRQLCGA